MSAPLVVNTTDGTCWTRREGTRDGQALYALEAVRECPEHLMETYAELVERGIVGQADVLPMPVGQVLQVDPVAAARRLDLLGLMDERAASVVSPLLAAVLGEAERLRARVAELEQLAPAEIQTCRMCGAGYTYGNPCTTCEFRARMAAETATAQAGRHVEWCTGCNTDHDPDQCGYRPELGGAS